MKLWEDDFFLLIVRKDTVHYDKQGLIADLGATGHMISAVRKQKVMNA